jgi:serine phosphatase RsbU (regulator of sigma subunit)
LGGRGSPKPVERSTRLGAGDRLVLVSDGVVGPGTGRAGLRSDDVIKAASSSSSGSAADTVRKVHGAVLEASDGDLRDDATVVCLAVS